MAKISTLSDSDLVEFIRTKNKEVYGEIIKRYQDKLMRYALYLVRNNNQAVDVVQEAFIKAYINLNGFNIKKKFSSWIYRIVHNEAMNFIKKNKREVPLIEAIDLSGGKNVEKDLEKKEIIKMAHDCLDKMPIIYSEPLTLFFLEEKSYEEISDILRMPAGTVAVRISRAKTLMKKICETKK